MSSLREIKDRIASVRNTLKITSAMKMVASAKLFKAQTAIGNKLPYEQKLHHILAGMLQDDDLQKAMHDRLGFGGHSPVVLQDVSTDSLPLKDMTPRVAIVAVSSNDSLCGNFNLNIIKEFERTVRQLYQNGYSVEDLDVYAVGNKMADAARKSGLELKGSFPKLSDKPDYESVSDFATSIVDSFVAGEVAQVILLYSHFASTGSQPVVRENYLPLPLHDYDYGAEPVDYILEPEPLELVKALLPQVLMLKMYTVLLDASAAQHATRTVAMQIASDNAEDLISELTLEYNKRRQQEITSEILDLFA